MGSRTPVQAEPLHTVAEAAAYLRCSEATVRRLIALQHLRTVRIGRKVLLYKTDLVTFCLFSSPQSQGSSNDSTPRGLVLNMGVYRARDERRHKMRAKSRAKTRAAKKGGA